MFIKGRTPVRLESKRGIRIEDDTVGAKIVDRKIILRMGKYFKPHSKQVLLILIGMIVYTATVVAMPKLIEIVINDYITTQDMSGLYWAVAAFVGIAAVQMVSEMFHRRLMNRVGQDILMEMRVDLFNHLQKLSMSYFDRNEVGKVMSRVQNDVRQLQELLAIAVVTLADVFSLAGIVAIMLYTNAKLSVLTFLVIPPLAALMVSWQRFARRAYMRVRLAAADVNSDLQENISGIRVVQSLNRESANFRRFGEANRENFRANMYAQMYAAMISPAIEILAAISLATVIVIGGSLAISGTVEVGVIVAFALYIQRFFGPVQSLSGQYASLQRAMVAGERIFELLDTKPDVMEKPGALELPKVRGEIVYDHVEFHYTPDRPVLRGINLHIPAGYTVALVGPTGAGKTSIMSLLMRLYDVTKGRITIDGHDVRDVSLDSLAHQMSVVPQEPYLFSGSTLKENIRYCRTYVTDEDIVRSAKAVGAHDFIMKLEKGYDTPLQERGGNLSTGQRQLISFARAIAANPQILLLDEATANIDTQSEVMIQKALDEMLKDRTAVIIAHRLSTIRHADLILVLERGQIVERGKHDELIAKGGLYAKLSSYNMIGDEIEPSADGSENGNRGHT
ncbi:MAG: ABC transporter ATP-binding protein [SAR202 cluster bacterium]|nr:ABC transporter ATP-binding protein [SAR202 cluster bacterium]